MGETTPESSLCSETIDELVQSPFSDQHQSTTCAVSERVQTLASRIYNELQRIMSLLSNDDEAVSGLMPLIVNVLESLDLSIKENQQLQVELELCKDDYKQLVAAFDTEITSKKKIEQQLIELELQNEEDKQQLSQKVESVESTMRKLELKAKSSADHLSRLEEKESEMKSEYNNLYTRYTELLRSHCDLMERVKILIGSEDFSSANNSSGPPSLAASAALMDEIDEMPLHRPPSLNHPTVSNRKFLGLEKEVENLIPENNELLATKNALNNVKDDFIDKVDNLESELTMSNNENRHSSPVKNCLKREDSHLKEEIEKLKQINENLRLKLREDDEHTVPSVQKRRFTRIEMAPVAVFLFLLVICKDWESYFSRHSAHCPPI